MTTTLVSLWTDVRRRLEAAGIETPVFDARLLVEAGAGVSRLDIVTDPRRPVTDEQVAAVDALVRRREAREPVGHIIGRRHFWTLDLFVSPAVLIPRPETELLVETVLHAIAPDAPARVLDLGIGSGAISLAILSERKNATCVGVDISDGALAVAQANADALGVADRLELKHGGWDVSLDGAFDLVLSNPPYVATKDIDTLAPEVARFEPRLALDGGPDGLEPYRLILAEAGKWLKPTGAILVEIGHMQGFAVSSLFFKAGLRDVKVHKDLAGLDRVVEGHHL